MSFLSPGVIAALFSILAGVAGHFGSSALSAFLMDPATVQTAFTVLSGVLALSAGVLKGVQAPKAAA